ncbi:hypothetical protein AGR7B_Cc20031 [Agrobacterium deltaense RV3]|nr:hypothetical protein AGR7B_Cc20031 [Agrobacterium deltaense RV3]
MPVRNRRPCTHSYAFDIIFDYYELSFQLLFA